MADQIFIIKELLSFYKCRKQVVILFIEFKKVYNSVKISRVLKVIYVTEDFSEPSKLIRLLDMTLKKTKNNIWIEGETLEDFNIKIGLRQGDPLSPLFNMVLKKIIKVVM